MHTKRTAIFYPNGHFFGLFGVPSSTFRTYGTEWYVRNGFVSSLSSFAWYGSCSVCTAILIVIYSSFEQQCVRLVRQHGKGIRKVWKFIRNCRICNDTRILSAAVRMPVGMYVSPDPNRHEWLIRRENVKWCVWFGNFFSFGSCARFVAIWGLVRQPLKAWDMYVAFLNSDCTDCIERISRIAIRTTCPYYTDSIRWLGFPNQPYSSYGIRIFTCHPELVFYFSL